jgi:hypothetical protein
MGKQPLTPLASSDAQLLGFRGHFNLSSMNVPPMDDFVLPENMANLSNDPALLMSKLPAYRNEVINLTVDDDKNDKEDDDATEVSWLRNTHRAQYDITLTPPA